MKIQFLSRTPFILKALLLLVVATSILSAVIYGDAQAVTNVAMDPSCGKMQTFGFSAGLVYCVQASIGNAVNQYVAALQKNLHYYEGMAMAVAIIFFGFKLMNSHVQDPIKSSMTLMFRIMIGVFFYSQAGLIYNDIAGTPPNNDGIINEAIGWVTGFSNNGAGGSGMFANLISANCVADSDAPPQQFEGFQVWQAFDCMFSKIFGAANPAKHPFAFGTSLLIVLGAALFSATLGVIAAMLGISLFFCALLMLFRALYLVLMSYICIGFTAMFAPLVAPLLFFDSKFLTEKFKRWLGVIVSCIFQPVLVIGFLAMAVTVDDKIIEGSFPNCKPPTAMTPADTVNSAPPAGFGQDGTGVCSFTQLFNNGQSGPDSAGLEATFKKFFEPNSTVVSMSINGTPQAHKAGTLQGWWDPTAGVNVKQKRVGVALGNPFEDNASAAEWGGATRVKKYTPLRQLMLPMLTFIFVTCAMNSLMKLIPEIASTMTTMVGLNLSSQPTAVENFVQNTLSGAEDGLKGAVAGKNLMNMKWGDYGRAIGGALQGVARKNKSL